MEDRTTETIRSMIVKVGGYLSSMEDGDLMFACLVGAYLHTLGILY